MRRSLPCRISVPDQRGEEGFILLESIIAISLITVVMGALASLTLNVVSGTNELRARQGAAQVATSAMAAVGALPATDLITGRDSTSVRDQFRDAPPSVQPWLDSMSQESDGTPGLPAGAGATATIATSPTLQTLNSIGYSVATYLGSCAMRDTTASAGDCVIAGTGTSHLRAVVAVSWTGRGCRAPSCTYVTATLVNGAPDPVFNTNLATPPTRPVVTDPGDQVSTRGIATSLQLQVDAGTGTAPLTWQVTAGTLPVGLSLAADGVVSGTPTALVSATPLTVTVRDAYDLSGTASFTWSVVAPPSIRTPPAQSTVQGESVSLATTATCPNAPCSFSVTGVPAGLGIDAATGVISGTPTTPGTSSVTVTVTDADGATASTSAFTWRVLAPATIAAPGTLRASVGTVVSVPVSYTCPAGPCTLTLSGTASGVGLSASTPNSTNNTVTTLSLPAGAGTVYLAGTVQTGAVPAGSTSRTYAPTLRITSPSGAGPTSAPGDWTVFVRPTIGAVGNRNATVGAPKDVPIAYTCPHTTCTITLANSVPGLGLSTTPGRTAANNTTSVVVSAPTGSVYISGTVSNAAVPSGTSRAYPLTLTITDAGTATVTSSGVWTATTAPKLTNPGSQAVEPNQDLSLQLSAACSNGGCTWVAESQTAGSQTWNPVAISSTGRITATKVPSGSYTVRVTVTDADNITDTVSFPVAVQTFSLSIPNQSTPRSTVETVDVAALMNPLASGYVYELVGNPPWLSISSSGVLTATPTAGSSSTNNITVRVTSVASPGSTETSDKFRWTVS
ncbi:MAG: putative Ig domain-containing protein [Nocardioides sp.]|nr:putative Ig domain-containing protein [Nocardioides sp.]